MVFVSIARTSSKGFCWPFHPSVTERLKQQITLIALPKNCTIVLSGGWSSSVPIPLDIPPPVTVTERATLIRTPHKRAHDVAAQMWY